MLLVYVMYPDLLRSANDENLIYTAHFSKTENIL